MKNDCMSELNIFSVKTENNTLYSSNILNYSIRLKEVHFE